MIALWRDYHARRILLVAGEVADLEPPSRNQRAGRHIPRLHPTLVVRRRSPPAGAPAHVDRGRADAANGRATRGSRRATTAACRARTAESWPNPVRDQGRWRGLSREEPWIGLAVVRGVRPSASRRIRSPRFFFNHVESRPRRARRMRPRKQCLTANAGIPNTNLTVPSSGSTTQRRRPAPVAPPYSPSTRRLCRRRALPRRLARSWQADPPRTTGSVGVLFVRAPPLVTRTAPPSRSRCRGGLASHRQQLALGRIPSRGPCYLTGCRIRSAVSDNLSAIILRDAGILDSPVSTFKRRGGSESSVERQSGLADRLAPPERRWS